VNQPAKATAVDRRQLVIELSLATILLVVPLFLLIGAGDLSNDEAIYSFAADSIVATGDWLNPADISSDDAPFLEKPPLKFWLVATGLKLGLPDSNWGHRFFDALFGALIIGYLVVIGLRIETPWAGLSAAVMFFVFQRPLIVHGILNNLMESALILQYCGSVYHFIAKCTETRSTVLPVGSTRQSRW